MKNSSDWNLVREVEEGLKQRLDRHLLLDHLSVTDLEKLNFLLKEGSNDYLTQTLNDILEEDK